MAAELATAPETILISEDFWTSRLYRNEMATVEDYAKYSQQLRNAMGPHVAALLRLGIPVVLDFNINTIAIRTWIRGILQNTDTDHVLHFLDIQDDVCKARLHQRNAAGIHEFTVSDAEFDIITSYFVAPRKEEGFNVVHHLATRSDTAPPS